MAATMTCVCPDCGVFTVDSHRAVGFCPYCGSGISSSPRSYGYERRVR
jgi:hypothetical protein